MMEEGSDGRESRHLPYIAPTKAPLLRGGAGLFPLPPQPRINGVGRAPDGMPSPEAYWDAVDSWLAAFSEPGAANATWTELAMLYANKMPVVMAAQQVMLGRGVQVAQS